MAEPSTHTTRLGRAVAAQGVMLPLLHLGVRLSQLELILAEVLDLLQPAPESSGSNQRPKELQLEELLCPLQATHGTSRRLSRLQAHYATQLTMSKDT